MPEHNKRSTDLADIRTQTAPRTLALGRDYVFVQWAQRLLAAQRFQFCQNVESVLNELRAADVDLIVINIGDLQSDRDEAIKLLHAAAPDTPLVGVTQDTASADSLAADDERLAFCMSLSGEPEELSQALGALRRRQARLTGVQRKIKAVTSKLRTLGEWQQNIGRWTDELLHELRTPVGVLRGFCSNLLDDVHGPLSEPQRTAVERMKVAVELLVDLLDGATDSLPQRPVSDVAEFVEPRAPQRSRLSLDELCGQVVALLVPRAAARGVTIRLQPEPCPAVWGERIRILQLLVNLLSNSLRFTPSGGRIEVALRSVPWPADHRLKACQVLISDTGPGLPDGIADEIFLPGWSTDTESGHAGMGLAICQQVVQEHSGTLEVDRGAPSGGACFVVTLPVDPRKRRRAVRVRWIKDTSQALRLLSRLRGETAVEEATEEADAGALAKLLAARGGELLVLGDTDARVARALRGG